MVTEDFAAVGGPATVAGGAPLPGDRPLGRPMLPNAGSRGAPGVGLLLLENGGMAPLPAGWRNKSIADCVKDVIMTCQLINSAIIKVGCWYYAHQRSFGWERGLLCLLFCKLNVEWTSQFIFKQGIEKQSLLCF